MEKSRDITLDKAMSANRESKRVDFKVKFDPSEAREWCEIVKDMVAMANSGGGTIIVGVKNDGSPSGEDVSALLQIDPAKITDKIAKYTGEQFDKFAIREAYRGSYKLAILQLYSVSIPMIFTHPGTYDIGNRRQESAFSKGSVYFRHGAKSEPGNSNDLREWLERELRNVKKSWLGNIRKIVQAPIGHETKVLPPDVVQPNLTDIQPVRIVDDPNAPAYRQVWDESAYRSP